MIINVVANYLKTIASDAQAVVTGIFDGDTQHHSKRALIKRRSEREIAKINYVYCRQLALSLASKLDIKNNNTYALSKMRKEMADFNKQSKSLGKKTGKMLPIDSSFLTVLETKLIKTEAFETNKNGGVVLPLLQNYFQADSLLDQHNLHSISTFITFLTKNRNVRRRVYAFIKPRLRLRT